jgi:phage terminase large subunit GpA-like protein
MIRRLCFALIILNAHLFGHALHWFEPRPQIRSLVWFRAHAFTQDGDPYDHEHYPHVGAPGGPCDALDDPEVKEIALQWGSQVGKSMFGQWSMQFLSITRPAPMMFTSADEKLAIEEVARLYQQMANSPLMREQLLPEHKRKDDLVRFRDCRMFVAWPRSATSLASKTVRWGHAQEIDKWHHVGATDGKAKEAHPLKLFDNRFKRYPSHKKIKESTPTVKNHSAIERLRLASTNCRYCVPCPHCGHFQALRLGDGQTPGGIRWQKLPNGRHDKDLARRTAVYICESCAGKIEDHHRGPMMRCGVWCPEGCTVNQAAAAKITGWKKYGVRARGGDGVSTGEHLGDKYEWQGWSKASWIDGKPARNGPDAGYHLSSLYALSLGWGEIAAEYVSVKDDPQSLRDFINSWLAETWEVRSRQQTWEQLGGRLIDPTISRGILPPWAALVTAAIDRQQDFYVYVIDAWGPDRRSHTVEYGETETLDELTGRILERSFPFADNDSVAGKTAQLKTALTLIDSGYRPEGIYEYCAAQRGRRLHVWPSKGSSTPLNAIFQVNTLGANTSNPGVELVFIDPRHTQGWLDKQLHEITKGEPGCATLHAGSLGEHQDFLEQLLNDEAVLKLDSANNAKEVFERIDASVPNDFRDCRRYSYVAMLLTTGGRPIPARGTAPPARRRVVNPGTSRPDGRPWI